MKTYKYKTKAAVNSLKRNIKIISVLLLVAAVGISAFVVRNENKIPVGDVLASVSPESEISDIISNPVSSDTESGADSDGTTLPKIPESEEMRAVWVPFMTLTMESGAGETQFREKFEKIAENSAAMGMNALIVHVRPFSDALYKSQLYPWSHILTGTQGKDPGYDPLEIMVEIAHKHSLALHAWVNPLRISAASVSIKFSDNSPYTLWSADESKKDYIMEKDGNLYMNPAYEEVREYIAAGVVEIAKNYDIDGVQFDDYFYPANSDEIDEKAYGEYASNLTSPLSLHDFREANINMLICDIYSKIKAEDSSIVFGISPQGNFDNNYAYCADVASWGSISGYVDYICPQMYVSLDNPYLPFETTIKRWRDTVSNENVKLYVGLAVYKAGTDADSGDWSARDDIIAAELTLSREAAFDGVMFYSYDYMVGDMANAEMQNVMELIE